MLVKVKYCINIFLILQWINNLFWDSLYVEDRCYKKLYEINCHPKEIFDPSESLWGIILSSLHCKASSKKKIVIYFCAVFQFKRVFQLQKKNVSFRQFSKKSIRELLKLQEKNFFFNFQILPHASLNFRKWRESKCFFLLRCFPPKWVVQQNIFKKAFFQHQTEVYTQQRKS